MQVMVGLSNCIRKIFMTVTRASNENLLVQSQLSPLITCFEGISQREESKPPVKLQRRRRHS